MSNLFSHSTDPDDALLERPPLTASVTVPAPSDHAWAGLTEHLHLWWPADRLSRWGEGSFFDLEDSALVETSEQEDENVWGERADGVPGRWLELTWRHVGADLVTSVRLDMAPVSAVVTGSSGALVPSDEPQDPGGGSTLALTHSGWRASDPQSLFDFYRDFWPIALDRYRRFMGGS
jgi:hypothetical protein